VTIVFGRGQLAMAAAGSASLIGGKAGSSGVDQLPKEMHDMKIRGQQINHIDDKVSQLLLHLHSAAKVIICRCAYLYRGFYGL
jgi:hypothetical protein